MTGIITQNVGRPSGLIKAPVAGGGSMTLIKTLTASSSSTLSFVNGSSDVVLDSTYPIYKFSFINMHPATNNVGFSFNFSVDTGSNYKSEEHTSELQSRLHIVCRLLLENKKNKKLNLTGTSAVQIAY